MTSVVATLRAAKRSAVPLRQIQPTESLLILKRVDDLADDAVRQPEHATSIPRRSAPSRRSLDDKAAPPPRAHRVRLSRSEIISEAAAPSSIQNHCGTTTSPRTA